MKNEVLCKSLCHNICCLIQSQIELGIEPVFCGEQPAATFPAQPIPPATVVAPEPAPVKTETSAVSRHCLFVGA
jgi:hypothetical protein